MSSAPSPDVTLVFETDNEDAAHGIRLTDSMDAWRRQTRADRVLEWIVVAPRGPRPEEERAMEGMPVRWLEKTGLTYYEQKNAAFDVARGRWIAMADSDALPAQDWLEKALAAIEAAEPSVALVSGSTLYADGPFSKEMTLAHFPVQGPKPADVTCACAGNTIFRVEAVRRTHFPGTHIRHGADMELARQLSEAGWRSRFDPSIRMLHNYASRLRELWGNVALKGYCYARFEEYLGLRRRGAVINGIGRFRVLAARLREMRPLVGIPAWRVPFSLAFYAWYCVVCGTGYSRALRGGPEPVSRF